MELGPRVIFSIGSVNFTETVVFAWIISAVILLFAFIATRNLKSVPNPISAQAVAELLVDFVYKLVNDVMGEKKGERFAPYIGTLIMFLALGSCLGMLDLRPITADLNCTVPLALITFLLIHYNAVKARGFVGYNKHLAEPYVFIWPMNVLSECMFPVTLACRIFGNILSGVIIMSLVYGGLEALSEMIGSKIPFLQIGIPLPLNGFFDLFEPGLQAYIFCMLTIVYISNGMDVEEE